MRARPSYRRICVFRALQLGDMICAGPALRALRRRFPRARVTLVGLPWAADFAGRMDGCIDDFIEFPGWPGLPERQVDEQRLPAFLHAMRERRFDLAVQLHGSGRLTNAIVRSFGATRTAGHRPADVLPDGDDEDFWPYPDHLHEVHRNLHLVGRLGAPTRDDGVTFPLHRCDHVELRRRLPEIARLARRSFVCMHPGARDPAKRWPPALFAEVGDALAARGCTIVLTGSGAERELAAEVAARMKAPAWNAACDVSIGPLAALLSRARLLVSNDTGVVHVAAALRVPSVVVFFATDPARWAPLDRRCNIVIHDPKGVPAAQVIDSALHLLDTRTRAASGFG